MSYHAPPNDCMLLSLCEAVGVSKHIPPVFFFFLLLAKSLPVHAVAVVLDAWCF